MRTASLTLLALPMLAGCHARTDQPNASARSAPDLGAAASAEAGGSGMSVTIPGLDAKVMLPAFEIGRHVDLDGIRLAPRTKVSAMEVATRDDAKGEKGQVVVRFANPQPPAALIAYYRQSAAVAGFEELANTAGALTGRKGRKSFALTVTPAAAGSIGTITFGGG